MVFDAVVSLAALVALAPVLALLAALVVIESRGNPIYRQTRVGLHGRPFRIVKLRTMQIGAESQRPLVEGLNGADPPLFKVKSRDPRVTMLGSILRRASLDELPQLLNVLLGQMSLVGPRPLVPEEAFNVPSWASARTEVRPGMTGLWQVSGRHTLSTQQMLVLDLEYVRTRSLRHDLRILGRTFRAVIRGTGAY
jgi:lipopolysaccharide/colanic/teichoic acid biosynthesis glycosyltransferase